MSEQLELKFVALQFQKGFCVCGEKVNLHSGELHHALISRQDVRGSRNKNLIHSPFNVVVLHKECHQKITREQSYKFLCSIYGQEIIKEWYNEFPFRSKFRRLEEYDD